MEIFDEIFGAGAHDSVHCRDDLATVHGKRTGAPPRDIDKSAAQVRKSEDRMKDSSSKVEHGQTHRFISHHSSPAKDDAEDGKKQVPVPHTKHNRFPIPDLSPCPRECIPFDTLTHVQHHFWHSAFESDANLVISAPTGCGKTLAFELGILRLWKLWKTGRSPPGKIIFLSPSKAIATEKVSRWQRQFSPLDLKVALIMGGMDDCVEIKFPLEEFATHDIIVSTLDKFDAITRHWKDNHGMLSQVGLVLVDEIHILGTDRGAALEVVIARMRAVQSISAKEGKTPPVSKLRIIAVSATIPNATTIARWLECEDAGALVFGENYRPVPLQITVKSYQPSKNEFLFEKFLNYRVFPIIRGEGLGTSTLVFCTSRNGARGLAKQLIKDARGSAGSGFIANGRHAAEAQRAKLRFRDKVLGDCVAQGVGFHSAEVSAEDRKHVEQLFTAGIVTVLCTTSTLAQGKSVSSKQLRKAVIMISNRCKPSCSACNREIHSTVGWASTRL